MGRLSSVPIQRGRVSLNDVQEVVVIGYSFPYFNREIDDLIFNQSYPRRIYLQYPDGEHSAIEERLRRLVPKKTLPDIEIVHKKGIDLFFIPDTF